jgi:hypothetical protein
MKIAMKREHVAVIELLLRDPRLDFTGEQREAASNVVNGKLLVITNQ